MNLINLVSEYFGPLCKNHNLIISSINDKEVVLSGQNCIFLVWMDYDGVSVKYVIRDNDEYSVIDIGSYMASKRRWHIAKIFENYSDYEKIVRQGLASYALTLGNEASDILSGDNTWLKKCAHKPMKLSQESISNIKSAINLF